MKYKGFYDDTYKHIGFIGEDDDRTPFDNFVEFSEEEMMEIFNQTNGMFIYDKDTPEDLSKIKPYEPEVIITEEMQRAIDEGKKQIEKQKAMDVINRIQIASAALTMPVEQVLEIRVLFSEWKDLIGKTITKERYPYIQHNGELYNLQQDTVVQEEFEPGKEGMLSIYAPVLINPSNPEPQPWKQPIPPQSYNKGDQVTHKGFVWESGVDGNVWEPGAPGIYDNIWKKIREV